ncbi:hypothetical protein M9H77_07894 [Catharanthus roseus]|uniref:Uncharacterized protein n=1 Tax=Catharanthus roseus TaxID=4058 RepID=A0ACC0BWF6_CATRO|nr:hypothetical protein M9H77_07894 [Catharanthus roseus]
MSLSLPTPPPEAVFFGGPPPGAIEAIKAAYGVVAQILDPPRDGFSLTLKLNLSKLPPDDGSTNFFVKVTMGFCGCADGIQYPFYAFINSSKFQRNKLAVKDYGVSIQFLYVETGKVEILIYVATLHPSSCRKLAIGIIECPM